MTEPDDAPPTAETQPDRRTAVVARRIQFYSRLAISVLALVVLILLAVENTRPVRVSWVVGTGNVRLVWLVLVVALAAYILGLLTAVAAGRSIRRPSADGRRR
jgi:uncharacterized integral membrane protein